MTPKLPAEYSFRACDCTFVFRCADEEIVALLECVFGGLRVAPASATSGRVIRRCSIERLPLGEGFRVSDGHASILLEDEDTLLFHIDQSVILALQLAREDLFFLHAAVVALDGRAAVLSAESGTGKSTLTLAMLAKGLEYMSDELAPIDLQRLTVRPYPHALCLKGLPPSPHALPPATQEIGRRFHLSATSMPRVNRTEALPIAMFVFLQRGEAATSQLHPITPATAAVRLMSQGLNLLAHGGEGLDAAVALGQHVPCFDLDISSLEHASEAIKESLAGAVVRAGVR